MLARMGAGAPGSSIRPLPALSRWPGARKSQGWRYQGYCAAPPALDQLSAGELAQRVNLSQFWARKRGRRQWTAENRLETGKAINMARSLNMAGSFAAPRDLRLVLAALVFSLVFPLAMGGARAQDAAPEQPAAAPSAQKSGDQKPGEKGGRGSNTPASPAAAEQHRLPPDVTTKQTLALPGRSLAFSATAGSIRLFDDKGEPQADIAYTSYQLDGADPATRPVTFLFNGGPGAASAYLQLGIAGPWRLPINGDAGVSSASPDLQPNAETWLDFTDLVFIDPVGTGYSR
ncbi:MAG TPA: hypothetical protein VHT74_04365, partial [Acetobacteraceae bacterium]|nr:hypothetical protein [Acetobacteraceae bacterium]